MEVSSAAEQRANAVAKLKRAASLPRMKNGWRPPMHAEASSDGDLEERSKDLDQKDDEGSRPELNATPSPFQTPPNGTPPSTTPPIEFSATETLLVDTTVPETPEPVMEEGTSTTPKTAKRRSRSRSRSRGSKDLKAKMKALESPMQQSFALPNEQTFDAATNILRPPMLDAVMSPIPSYLAQMQMLSPMSPIQYPGTSPPTPIPSLEALQNRHLQGLFRSNSAAARMMAMHKLTGGAEPLDTNVRAMSPFSASPFRTGTPMLGRNNTVSGGERIAVRQMLLKRLNERIEKTDGEQTSGGEDRAPTPTKRSRKRRSRQKATSTVIEEPDHASSSATNTADNTPTATLAALAPDIDSRELSTPTQTLPSPLVPSPSHDRNPEPPNITMRDAKPTSSSSRYVSPMGLRGVVIEDAEDEEDVPVRKPPTPSPHNLGIPETLLHASALRAPHSSLSTARSSPDSDGAGGTPVPVIMSHPGQRSPFRQDSFPKSPFSTPLKEKQRDDDEERVLYPENHGSASRFPWIESQDREISWAAEPVPEIRAQSPREPQPSWIEHRSSQEDMSSQQPRGLSWISDPGSPVHVHVEDEDTSYDDTAAEETAVSDATELHESDSPSVFRQSQNVVVEVDTSSDVRSSSTERSRPSVSDVTAIRESDMSSASADSAATLGAMSMQSGARSRSHSSSTHAWDESTTPTEASGVSTKASVDGLAGTWGRMRNTFSRSNSSTGRRSRTNSTSGRDKKDNNDSSRESGVSLNSGRRESKGDGAVPLAWQSSQASVMQTPSASASILSLAPPPRNGVSPIPPLSDAESARYTDPKLFPFPGMKRLQEESMKGKGITSASSPDIVFSPSMSSDKAPHSTASTTSVQSTQSSRVQTEETLIHQHSDSRLFSRYQAASPAPAISAISSQASQVDYFNVGSQTSPGSQQRLPHTREGVRKWLKFFSPQASDSTVAPPTPGTLGRKSFEAVKKPSLSDFLLGRKESDYISDWEADEKTRAPTSASVSTVKGPASWKADRSVVRDSSPEEPASPYAHLLSRPILQPTRSDASTQNGFAMTHESLITPLPSPADPPSSTTPDPPSSADDSSAQSSHASAYSLTSSLAQYSTDPSPKATEILQRLDEILKAGDLNRMWSSAVNNRSRRLLLSTPMLQVVNANTVKDRFLFLFTDLLIIAKPIMPRRDSLLDNTKPYPPDRKFIVKSVVHLKDLRLNIDRDEDLKKLPGLGMTLRSPSIRSFIHEFTQDPDIAIYKLIDIRRSPDAYQVLGRLLVQMPELHKGKLGEYLARRSSRQILKAYLDAVGFAGVALDEALRIFLLSIHIPSGPGLANTLEYLLEVFAGRWYEANAGIVAFDKDLAVRLVRSIIRLNEVLHPSLTDSSNGNRHFVHVRDFMEVFRRHDPRCLIPDGALEKIYNSVWRLKISQSRDPSSGRQPITVTMKRNIPSRLTYKRQSDPIVVRIPQVDTQLTIHVHGKDLIFEPSVLSFSKSTEASFRVTGTSLGPKSLVMACSGPSAPNYVGLPMSSTVVVERAFMRNTFQIAFLNREGSKRKYMFSVDDPVIRQEWTSSLKRQIDCVQSNIPPDLPTPVQMQVYRAAETLSFTVLQETLLTRSPHRSTSSPSERHMSNDLQSRSQSRSQMYSMQADRLENSSADGSDLVTDGSHPPGTHLWSSHDLESTCQQSSSIALVLSFLQAALPYNTENGILSDPPRPSPTYYHLQKTSNL